MAAARSTGETRHQPHRQHVRREEHPAARGPRRRPQAAGHVHRRHRARGPPPPGVGADRQRRRRGRGRASPTWSRSRSTATARSRWPTTAAASPSASKDGQAHRARDRVHRAARRRQVRRRAPTRRRAASTASAPRWSTRSPRSSSPRSTATAPPTGSRSSTASRARFDANGHFKPGSTLEVVKKIPPRRTGTRVRFWPDIEIFDPGPHHRLRAGPRPLRPGLLPGPGPQGPPDRQAGPGPRARGVRRQGRPRPTSSRR